MILFSFFWALLRCRDSAHPNRGPKTHPIRMNLSQDGAQAHVPREKASSKRGLGTIMVVAMLNALVLNGVINPKGGVLG